MCRQLLFFSLPSILNIFLLVLIPLCRPDVSQSFLSYYDALESSVRLPYIQQIWHTATEHLLIVSAYFLVIERLPAVSVSETTLIVRAQDCGRCPKGPLSTLFSSVSRFGKNLTWKKIYDK